MTIHQFIPLSLVERIKCVRTNGEAIDQAIKGDFIYTLYFIDSFYIESVIKVSKYKTEIVEISAFKYGERFDKYLEKFSLKYLQC